MFSSCECKWMLLFVIVTSRELLIIGVVICVVTLVFVFSVRCDVRLCCLTLHNQNTNSRKMKLWIEWLCVLLFQSTTCKQCFMDFVITSSSQLVCCNLQLYTSTSLLFALLLSVSLIMFHSPTHCLIRFCLVTLSTSQFLSFINLLIFRFYFH